MFFQETPPDTSAYMIAGYTVFFLISAIYLLSLFLRRRNLEQDLKTLESLAAEGRPAAAAGPSRTRPRASGQPRQKQKPATRKVSRRR